MLLMTLKKKILYIGNQLAGHDFSPTAADSLPPKLRELGFDVGVVSNKRNKVLRLIDMLWAVFRNRKTAAVVLIDTYSTKNYYYAVCVAVFCRFYTLPYVPILHGGDLPRRLKENKKWATLLFKKSKLNISPSAYLKDQFEAHGFSNIIHIPNSLAIENYPFLNRQTIDYKLLWVRSFDKTYNPLLALEVVEILMEKGKNVQLCMVGAEKDGSLELCKQRVREKNLPVTFTGLLSKKEWINLSTNYDLFINTTHFDNMPVSVMEAMALGLAVISTNVGGIPYLIKHNQTGLLVPPDHAEAFAEAIINTVENPLETNKHTKEARDKVAMFDWLRIKKYWSSFLANI